MWLLCNYDGFCCNNGMDASTPYMLCTESSWTETEGWFVLTKNIDSQTTLLSLPAYLVFEIVFQSADACMHASMC